MKAKNTFQAEEKFWNLRTESLYNLREPVCVMTLGPVPRPVAMGNILERL